MRHPAGWELQAHLDGELAPAAAATLAGHIHACPRCTALAAKFSARNEMLSLAVLEVDRAEPERWRTRQLPSVPPMMTARRSVPQVFRRAAVVLLAVAGAAAAAIVGREVVVRGSGPTSSDDVAVQPAGAAPYAGVFMALRADSAAIEVEDAGPGARIRVRISERTDVAVSVETEAGPPRFRVDERAGRIQLNLGGGTGTVTVDVPVSLPVAVVRAAGRVVVRITEGRVEPPEAAGDGVLVGQPGSEP